MKNNGLQWKSTRKMMILTCFFPKRFIGRVSITYLYILSPPGRASAAPGIRRRDESSTGPPGARAGVTIVVPTRNHAYRAGTEIGTPFNRPRGWDRDRDACQSSTGLGSLRIRGDTVFGAPPPQKKAPQKKYKSLRGATFPLWKKETFRG